MALDDLIPSDAEVREYILNFLEELDGVYINGTYIPLDGDYTDVEKEEGKIIVSGYGLSASWDIDELVDKVIKEKGRVWYKMSDEERREYVSCLFVKSEEE